jgi:hypothetical protein
MKSNTLALIFELLNYALKSNTKLINYFENTVV